MRPTLTSNRHQAAAMRLTMCAGEWLRYTVNVASAGTYTVTARVASAGSGGTFHIEFAGGGNTDAMRIPYTGGWQSYQDLTATVSLAAGVQSMWIIFDSNGSTGSVGNLSAVRFDYGSSAPAPAPAPSPSPSPSGGGGRLRVMTWNINFGHGNPYGQSTTHRLDRGRMLRHSKKRRHTMKTCRRPTSAGCSS